ncbi:hypothetical protein ACQPZ8_01445 [Actinomadura nitritigenes]|uniref:hypothetical protein n=1 Tax=Actinomadura nitritigenes TaxID=134602 RepID=UPI003D8B56F0
MNDKGQSALNLPDVSTLPVHDRTGLRALAVLPSGRIVWPVQGGAPDDSEKTGDSGHDDQGDGRDDDQDDDGGDGRDDVGDDDTEEDDADDGGAGDGKEKARRRRDRSGRRGSDDKTARTIAALREDFKGERSKRQAAEKNTAALQKQIDDMQAAQTKQADALAKALGLKKDDEPPTPEQLAKDFDKQLKAAQADTDTERQRADTAEANWREAAIQLAVYLAADDHDANAKALLDSARFLKKVAGLDPTDSAFEDQIAEAIKNAVDGNERLRKPKPRAAERSGGEMNTGPKPNRKRPASMSEAITNAYAK